MLCKVGHFYKVCQKRIANQQESNTNSKLNAMFGVKLDTVSATATQNSLQALCDVKINGIKASPLMDTGSSDCYMDKRFAVKYSLRITETNNEVTLAV